MRLIVSMILLLLFAGCATYQPLQHTPPTATYYKQYWPIPSNKIKKTSKTLPNGGPVYYYTEQIFRTFPSGKGYWDEIHAYTTGDTIGLDQLTDGSLNYGIWLATTDGGLYITKVESEKNASIRFEKERAVQQERLYNEYAVKKAKDNIMRDRSCGKIQDTYFCVDDTSKLKTHNKYEVSDFLTELTKKKYLSKTCYQEGQWFIERADEKTINVSLMCGDEFMADIIVSLIQRGGKFYYIEGKK